MDVEESMRIHAVLSVSLVFVVCLSVTRVGDVEAGPPERTKASLEAGCKQGDDGDCFDLAERLDDYGLGSKADQERAKHLYVKACMSVKDPKKEAGICQKAFWCTDPPFPTKEDLRKYAVISCDFGYEQPACVKAAECFRKGIGGPKDSKKALEYQKKADDLDDEPTGG